MPPDDHAELFKDWLTGRLSDEEHDAFEDRLDADPAFFSAWDAWFDQAPCDLPGLDDERLAEIAEQARKVAMLVVTMAAAAHRRSRCWRRWRRWSRTLRPPSPAGALAGRRRSWRRQPASLRRRLLEARRRQERRK